MIQVDIRNATYADAGTRGTRADVGPITVNIDAGEFVSLVGPAECGKTTLIKMIAGVLPVTGGEIRISGAKLSPPTREFGLALHKPALLPWRTSMENILLQADLQDVDRKESSNRARRLLAWFGLSRFESCRPHELPPGGPEAVAICRALVNNPSLLLMDEPFGTLDPMALEKMLDILQRLWAETVSTCILCTKNITEAVLLSDRIAVLSPGPGRILETISIPLPRPRRFDKATTAHISEYCGRIRTLFRAQGVLP